MSDEKQHQKIVTIVQCNTQRKPLHILICTAWKNPNVIIRPCHPCLLPRGIWYQCVILSDDAWGRAAIGCRPDAVDAERDLLAPDKYRVYVATRVGWFISTIRSCILFLTTAASVRTEYYIICRTKKFPRDCISLFSYPTERRSTRTTQGLAY